MRAILTEDSTKKCPPAIIIASPKTKYKISNHFILSSSVGKSMGVSDFWKNRNTMYIINKENKITPPILLIDKSHIRRVNITVPLNKKAPSPYTDFLSEFKPPTKAVPP